MMMIMVALYVRNRKKPNPSAPIETNVPIPYLMISFTLISNCVRIDWISRSNRNSVLKSLLSISVKLSCILPFSKFKSNRLVWFIFSKLYRNSDRIFSASCFKSLSTVSDFTFARSMRASEII